MAVMDPKQLLLKHVEKVVLLLALVVLLWAVYSYPPWSGVIEEEQKIADDLKAIRGHQELVWKPEAKDSGDRVPPGVEKVPDYLEKIKESVREPWGQAEEVEPFPQKAFIFEDARMQWQEEAPPAPTVLPPVEVLAKAEKSRVVVIFKIDHKMQRMLLQGTNVPLYAEGLPFEKIIVKRENVDTGQVEVRGEDGQWKPEGLPRLYGGASSVPGGGAMLDRPDAWGEGANVVMFSQRKGGDDAQRLEEELRAQQERDKRATPGPTPAPKPAPRRGGAPAAVGPVVTSDEQYLWYVDTVETEGKYRYSVTIVVRNPVYKSSAYKGTDVVPEFVSSTPKESNVVEIAPFREWHFTGGAPNLEQGWAVVKVQTVQERKLDAAAILRMVADMKQGTGGVNTDPAGEWVKDRFSVRPGEEIGSAKSVRLGNGQSAEVDFSTGIQAVVIGEGFQVVEDQRVRLVMGADGTMERVTVVIRNVVPKLSMVVMDRKGNVSRRWQETLRE